MESPTWPRSVAAEADVTLSLELSEIMLLFATPETQSGPATKVELSGGMQGFRV